MRTHALLAGLIALSAALVPGRSSAQTSDGLSVLEAAAARYRASVALCADFDQELNVVLLGERHTGRGRLCQRQPDLFMMRFSDPDGDRVIADGQYLWSYTPSSDPILVLKLPLGSTPGNFDFHREFLEDPASKYRTRLDGRETIDGLATDRIVLTPLQRGGYREAVLWIDTAQRLVRRIRIHEENGSIRTVSLSNIDMSATPPADAFRFIQPAGTQIFTP